MHSPSSSSEFESQFNRPASPPRNFDVHSGKVVLTDGGEALVYFGISRARGRTNEVLEGPEASQVTPLERLEATIDALKGTDFPFMVVGLNGRPKKLPNRRDSLLIMSGIGPQREVHVGGERYTGSDVVVAIFHEGRWAIFNPHNGRTMEFSDQATDFSVTGSIFDPAVCSELNELWKESGISGRSH